MDVRFLLIFVFYLELFLLRLSDLLKYVTSCTGTRFTLACYIRLAHICTHVVFFDRKKLDMHLVVGICYIIIPVNSTRNNMADVNGFAFSIL